MFSLFKKPDEEVAVIFDIGNGSVGAALVSFDIQHVPTILYTHREPLTFQSGITPKRLLESMVKLLTVVAEHVRKEGVLKLHKTLFGRPNIRTAYCVFSSPWYVSETKVVKYTQDKPFVVTEAIINDIIRKEETEFTAALEDGKYERLFGAKVRLLERKVIHTRLNGYEVSEPSGKSASEVELTFYISFIAEEILD